MSGSPQRVRVLAAATMLLVTAIAHAQPPRVCLFQQSKSVDLEAEDVANALRLEVRKRSLDLDVRLAASELECGEPAEVPYRARVRVGDGARASLERAGAEDVVMDVEGIGRAERAAEVARQLLSRLEIQLTASGATRLVESDREFDLSVASGTELGSGSSRPTVELTVGAAYHYETQTAENAGAIRSEVLVSWFDDRLGVGIAGEWAPLQASRRSEPAIDRTSGELLAMVRGGWSWGPWLLRLGVGGGYQWRTIEASSSLRISIADQHSGTPVVTAEPEITYRGGDRWRIAVGVPMRAYFGGVSQTWLEQTVYDAPTGSVGLSLRAGVSL